VEKKNRRILLLVVAAVAVLAAGGAALAQAGFPDVTADNAHKEAIDWAAEAGIVQGYTNGNFGPFDNVLRGQAASMFMRYDEFRMEPVPAMRGCPDCHAGPFILANEIPEGHPPVPADADVNDCLACHAMQADLTGNVAPLALRDIVHPVHMGSKIFAWELMGHCFSCHNVDAEGEFDVLSEAVDTDEKGIPDEVPIPGQQDPLP
jgi:hypothetical protein